MPSRCGPNPLAAIGIRNLDLFIILAIDGRYDVDMEMLKSEPHGTALDAHGASVIPVTNSAGEAFQQSLGVRLAVPEAAGPRPGLDHYHQVHIVNRMQSSVTGVTSGQVDVLNARFV